MNMNFLLVSQTKAVFQKKKKKQTFLSIAVMLMKFNSSINNHKTKKKKNFVSEGRRKIQGSFAGLRN